MADHVATATHSAGVELWVYDHRISVAEALPTSLPAIDAAKWKQMAMIKTLSHSGMDAKDCDVTHLSSPYQWREFIRGFKNAGELQFSAHFDDRRTSSNTRLGWSYLFDELFKTAEAYTKWWEIRVPDEDGDGGGPITYHRISCWAFVKGIPLNVPEDDPIDVSGILKYTSYPVLTLAAGNT